MSSFKGRDRLIFDGHFRYYNWIQQGPKLLLSLSSSLGWKEHLPSFIQELYNIQSITRIQEEEEQKYGGGIPTISMVRHPYERLASMYHYDRTKARNIYWRKDFISKRGNATLQECLLNSTCVLLVDEVSELSKIVDDTTQLVIWRQPHSSSSSPSYLDALSNQSISPEHLPSFEGMWYLLFFLV